MRNDTFLAAFISEKAYNLTHGIAVALLLTLTGAQPAYSQSAITDEQLNAVMVVVRMLLEECTDSDEDTLCDADELKYFFDLDEDADGDEDEDGLTNGEELNTYRSDPTSDDTDNDGILDYAESVLGMKLYLSFANGDSLGGDSPADRDLLHKLNRLSFGPTADLLGDVSAAGGINNWITAQLAPIGLPAPPPRIPGPDEGGTHPYPIFNSDSYPNPYDCTSHAPPDPAQAMRDCYVANDDDGDINVMGTIRPMHSVKQLQARMAMFWDNHFNTDVNVHGQGLMELHDEDYYFVNAFGNFNDLLEYNAKKYTMLEYLDLDDNVKTSPNENFPREVMELHSVSVGDVASGGNYDPEDIAQLSYILTGWDKDDAYDLDLCGETNANPQNYRTCEPPAVAQSYISRYSYFRDPDGSEDGVPRFDVLLLFEFRENDHDYGGTDWDNNGTINDTKTLTVGDPSTQFQIISANYLGSLGVLEGEEAITYLAQHTETAKFICTKLAQEFISDNPLPATISGCESVFLANTASPNQMGLVVQNLINSAEFNDPAIQRVKLKDTQEALISLARILGWEATHQFNNPNNVIGEIIGVERGDSVAEAIESAEQPLFEKAEPTGYYETSDNWRDTNVALRRFEEMNDMTLERRHDVPDDPATEPNEQQTRNFVTYFNGLGMNSSADIMVHLFQIMLGGHYDVHDINMAYEILHPEDGPFDLSDDTDVLEEDLTCCGNNIPDVGDRIRAVIARLSASPQFQLH